MNLPFKEINNLRTLAIFIICIVILIAVPVYWFFFVPPAMELQEINQGPFTATGYMAPGGYFNLELDLGKESIQGYHTGELNIVPNTTISQNGTIWQPEELRVDQWPGSKEKIKYASNNPLNKEMFLNIKINIPQQANLKGQTIPLNIKYYVNYPIQTGVTEVLGGTATNFEVKSDVIEKTVPIKLENKIITQKDMDIVTMNESWKKILSALIWLFDLIILIFFFTDFKIIETIKSKFKSFFARLYQKIKF
jgi:hypothetical protein